MQIFEIKGTTPYRQHSSGAAAVTAQIKNIETGMLGAIAASLFHEAVMKFFISTARRIATAPYKRNQAFVRSRFPIFAVIVATPVPLTDAV